MTLRNLGILLGLLVGASMAGTSMAASTATTSTVKGTKGLTDHGCLQLLTVNVGDGENCMYNGGPSLALFTGDYPTGEQTGPFNQVQYYDSSEHPEAFNVAFKPTPGDGKIHQIITGSVTVDNNGTANAADDLISFTILFKSPGAGDIIRQLGSTNTSAEDKYTTMTQVLAPHAVDSATPNAAGGYDYVIGSQGFPTRLTFTDTHANEPTPGDGKGPCVGELFGDMECDASFKALVHDPKRWEPLSTPASGRAGISSLEGNIGAKTTGTLTGYQCIDSGTNNACKVSKVSFGPLVLGPNNTPGGGVTAEDVGWDQLLLKVSTDASGKVISVEGYDVQEYMVFGPPVPCGGDAGAPFACNSWVAGHFDLNGIVADNDGPVTVAEGGSADISVLANDRGFTDPVTVTLLTPMPTAKGTAVVSGSPGNASGIKVTYTANAAVSGADTFIYQVTDGTHTDTAKVTVNVIAALGAQDDTATTGPGTPININVGANDVLAGATATVAIDNSSFRIGTIAGHGTAQVTAGNGGPPAGIVVTYTPSPLDDPLSNGYTETFSYTIDDGVSPPSTATVTVRINIIPVAKAATLTISTQGSDPLGKTVLFTAPGAGGQLGNAPVVITITSQGTHGTATVANNAITYTITDATLFHGADQFTYLITDGDGETSSANISINVPDDSPAFPVIPAIGTDQDHASTVLPLKSIVSYGNGDRSRHVVKVASQALHGTCSLITPPAATDPPATQPDGNSSLVYTPNTGYSGADQCTLTVADVDGPAQQASATFPITVNPLLTVTGKIGGASMDPWTLALFGALPLLRLRRVRRQAAAVAALLGVSISAFGQAAPKAAQEGGIAEIVVTARKITEKLQDVPLAITAFDSETIEATGIANLADVAALTPGLSFFNAFGENLPVPVIRGVVPTDIFGQNNAAVFIDGVYIAGREGLNFSQLDLERIEVIKGPQSAMYGRNSFSGAINYVTKRPGPDFEAKTSAEAGSAGLLKGSVMVSGPILGDMLGNTLRGRISVLYDNFDGTYSNPLSNVGIGGHLYRSYQASLRWLPVDELDVNLGYYKSVDRIDEPAIVALPANCEDKVEPPAGIPHDPNNILPDIVPTPGTRLQNFCGRIPGIRSIPGLSGSNMIPKAAQATGEKRDLDRLNLRIDWDLHDYGSVSSLSGFSYTRQSDVSDFTRSLGYSQPFLYCNPYSPQPGTAGSPNTCTDANGVFSPADKVFFSGVYDRELGARTTEFSEELRYTSRQDQRLRYTGGAYWYKSQMLNRPGAPILTNPPPLDANGAPIYGMPPFDAASPDFAIGSAIFYGTMTADGGIDPLGRISEKDETQGWAIFAGLDFDITDRLTAHAEARFNQENQQDRRLGYTPCIDKSVPAVAGCGDDFYNTKYADPIYLTANLQTGNPECLGLDVDALGHPNQYSRGRCSIAAAARFQLITWRTGLKFKVNDDWNAYGNIAYGEKPGGIRLISGTVVCPSAGPMPVGCPSPDGTIPTISPNPFGNETILSYELGLKGSAFDRRIRVDLSAFYNDWRRIVLRQLLEVDPVTGLAFSQPTGFNVNAGNAHVVGVELTTDVSIWEGLTGNFTFGWTDAKLKNARQDTYSKFPSLRADCGSVPTDPNLLRDWWNQCNQASGDVSGNTLLRQPEFKASASLAYTHPLAGQWDWNARVDTTYQSSVYVGNDNESWLPAHTYVNSKIGVRSPRYTVEFWARNLLNDGHAIAAFRDIYWANTSNLYNAPYTQGSRPNFDSFVPFRYSVTYPTERTIGIRADIRFGAAIK